MKTLAPIPPSAKRLFLATLLLAAAMPAAVPALAQVPAARIAGEVSSSERATLPNSTTPRAQARYSTGRLAGSTALQGMSITFSRTQAQESALKALIANQQNSASAQYHKWLTADQFAARFGLSDADIAKVESWLEQQGFQVNSVSRGKDMIRFSGTAAQAEQAFATELHTYSTPAANGSMQSHFAASTALSVPSALSGVVLGIRGLDNFKPHTHLANHRGNLQSHFTWEYQGTQYVYFDPGDIATVYDITKEYNASYTGANQTITIIGQSAISATDLTNFWTAAGITRNSPTITLVPDTGSSETYADGDEAESDLDLEWSGAIAKGAALNFIYSGNSKSSSAFDAIEYAVDQQLGTIISSSYGDCETDLGISNLQSLDAYLERGAAQGQTILSAAGDTGATDCLEDTSLSTSNQQALAVDYPASSAYVTAVGGTQISTASSTYMTPGDGYWASLSGSATSAVDTALQYIPEQAWNENSTCTEYTTSSSPTYDDVCAGGGGASAFFGKPSWQTGVTGIPSDGLRDVPDLALNAAIYDPGYVFCTSDQTFWDTSQGQKASCNSGFLDSSSTIPTVGGGTSFATPIFAGMLALINQQQGYTTGQGVVNSTLYTLASDSTTYASAFHDITTGNNACDITAACGSGTSSDSTYAAGAGYDQATGLGSVDLFNLAAAWPAYSATTSGLLGTSIAITANTTTPAVNASDSFAITLSQSGGGAITSGSISIAVDGGTATTETLSSSGTYTYAASFTTSGTHTITVSYAGDSTYAASTGTITVTVPGSTNTTPKSFTLAATSVTVAQGSSASSTVTITPAGGYTGTVILSYDTSNDSALENLCYQFTNTDTNGYGEVTVSGTAAVTTQFLLDTKSSDCVSSDAVARTHKHALRNMHAKSASSHKPADPWSNTGKPLAAGVAFAALLLLGFTRRSSKTLRNLAALLLVAAAGLFTTACGNSTGSSSSDPAKGTYTITLYGEDSTTSTITNSTTFTLTID